MTKEKANADNDGGKKKHETKPDRQVAHLYDKDIIFKNTNRQHADAYTEQILSLSSPLPDDHDDDDDNDDEPQLRYDDEPKRTLLRDEPPWTKPTTLPATTTTFGSCVDDDVTSTSSSLPGAFAQDGPRFGSTHSPQPARTGYNDDYSSDCNSICSRNDDNDSLALEAQRFQTRYRIGRIHDNSSSRNPNHNLAEPLATTTIASSCNLETHHHHNNDTAVIEATLVDPQAEEERIRRESMAAARLEILGRAIRAQIVSIEEDHQEDGGLDNNGNIDEEHGQMGPKDNDTFDSTSSSSNDNSTHSHHKSPFMHKWQKRFVAACLLVIVMGGAAVGIAWTNISDKDSGVTDESAVSRDDSGGDDPFLPPLSTIVTSKLPTSAPITVTSADHLPNPAAPSLSPTVPPSPPVNDNCATAIKVNDFPFSDNGSTKDATLDNPRTIMDNACTAVSPGDGSPLRAGGVWYQFEGNGECLQINTTPSQWDFYPIVAVYAQLNGCDSLRCERQGVKDFIGHRPRLTWHSQPGTTYSLLLAATVDETGWGGTDYDFTVTSVPCFENGECSGAKLVTEFPYQVTMGTHLSTNYAPVSAQSCQGIGDWSSGFWYSIQMSEIPSLSSSTATCVSLTAVVHGGFDPLYYPLLALYEGTCDGLQCLQKEQTSATSDSLVFNATMGVNYSVFLTGPLVAGGTPAGGDVDLKFDLC